MPVVVTVVIPFPIDEITALRNAISGAARVDWNAYDRAKQRIVATIPEPERRGE